VGLVASGAAGSRAASAFRDALKQIGTAFEQVAAVLQPIINSVLVPALQLLAAQVKFTADTVIGAVNLLRRATGNDAVKYDPNSATAVATRQAQVGDLRSLGNRAYTSAYNSQSSGGNIPQQQLEEAKKQTRLMQDWLNVTTFGLSDRAKAAGQVFRGEDRSVRNIARATIGDAGSFTASLRRMASTLF
jgi:hypothetical protein